MRPSFARRQRRSKSTGKSEGSFFKKESESAFFDSPVASPFFNSAPGTINRKCDKCEKEQQPVHDKKMDEEKTVQRKAVPGSGPVASVSALVGTLRGGGQTLPANLNYHFGSRMGRDFNDAVIHTGSQAAFSARSINAKAYTVGNHIVFAEGQYQPDTYEGKKLIAHELAHVAQQGYGKTGIYRMSATDNEMATEEGAATEQPIATSGQGEIQYENKTDFANCEGVSVQGLTNANYSHSYSFAGTATRSTGCAGCPDANCITDTGNITSVFRANPSVSLPAVPAGLNDCETAAVQAFINGTLSAHEQQHVAAFNTYTGTVTTPYVYNGCQSGEDAFIAGRHNAIESGRRAASNAASALLDANGANNFTITCSCPDPAPAPQPSPTPKP